MYTRREAQRSANRKYRKSDEEYSDESSLRNTEGNNQ